MFGTAMPEASIYKDRDASTREDNVRPDKPPADTNGEIFTIPKAESVKG